MFQFYVNSTFCLHYVTFSLFLASIPGGTCVHVWTGCSHVIKVEVHDQSYKLMASLVWCVRTLERMVGDLSNYADGRQMELDTIDSCRVQLERVYRELVGAEAIGDLTYQGAVGADHVRNALVVVGGLLESQEWEADAGYRAPIMDQDGSGRPRFYIPRHQLAYLLEKQFTVPQISDILQVSIRTVRRRMTEYDLSVRALYSQMSDKELELVVRDIQHRFPSCGNRQMQGHLLSRGIRVQQSRVREIQRRVDPVGSVMRQLRTIHRRQYRVNGPGALWHIDGHHKLIRCVFTCVWQSVSEPLTFSDGG